MQKRYTSRVVQGFFYLSFLSTMTSIHSSQPIIRPFVKLAVSSLRDLEYALPSYIPLAIFLIFEKWKFITMVTDQSVILDKYATEMNAIPVSLETIALAEVELLPLSPSEEVRYKESFQAIKKLVCREGISIKELIRIQSPVKRIVRQFCEQKNQTDTLIYKWANTFPVFSEEEELAKISAAELYILLNDMKELYRDIVMNLSQSHGTFKRRYLKKDNEKAEFLFKQFVSGQWANVVTKQHLNNKKINL